MNSKQMAALNGLGKAFLECRKANLVFAGVEGSLLATVDSPEFRELMDSTSSCEAILVCENHTVKTHGTYLDSGSA